MKCFIVLLFVGLLSQTAFGQNVFEDYLLEIQYQTQSLHNKMKGTIDNVRIVLSDYLNELNEASLSNALIGIQNVESIRQSTSAYISSLENADATCVADILETWDAEIATTGNKLSLCTYQADNTITPLVSGLLTELDAGMRTATSLQNIVIKTMSEWNPVNSADELSYLVGVQLDEIEINFDTVTVGELTAALEDVVAQVESLPAFVESCIDDAEEEFRSTALITENSANGCVA